MEGCVCVCLCACVCVCACTILYSKKYGRVCGLELVERLQAISDLITPSLSALRRSSQALSSLLLLLIPAGQSSYFPTPLHTVIAILPFLFSPSSRSLSLSTSRALFVFHSHPVCFSAPSSLSFFFSHCVIPLVTCFSWSFSLHQYSPFLPTSYPDNHGGPTRTRGRRQDSQSNRSSDQRALYIATVTPQIRSQRSSTPLLSLCQGDSLSPLFSVPPLTLSLSSLLCHLIALGLKQRTGGEDFHVIHVRCVCVCVCVCVWVCVGVGVLLPQI